MTYRDGRFHFELEFCSCDEPTQVVRPYADPTGDSSCVRCRLLAVEARTFTMPATDPALGFEWRTFWPTPVL